MYGRKLDPHQSAEDRAHGISVNLKSFLFDSMALSVFIAVTAADDKYNLNSCVAPQFLDMAGLSCKTACNY